MKHIPVLLGVLLILSACATVDTPVPIEDDAQNPSFETPELRLAQDWIRQAPTYAQQNGSELTLTEYYVLESYPEQHVMTFTFVTQDHEGVRQHTVEVLIQEQEIVRAILNGVWNEYTQEEIQEEIQLTLSPMQCDPYPWDEMIGSTAEDRMMNYYALLGIDAFITSSTTAEAVCMACHICPTGTTFYARVHAQHADVLRGDGWE